MGSCKTPLQLCGCLSTLSSCWLLSWPRPQVSSNSNNQDSSNSSNSNNQDSSNSSSSNQDSSSNSQDSSSNNRDSSSNSQDSSGKHNSLGKHNNLRRHSSSGKHNSSSDSSREESHLSKVSHPSKLWTDSVDLLQRLRKKLSNNSHPDQKFSSILRWTERVTVGSQWSCLMKSSLALPETSQRSL